MRGGGGGEGLRAGAEGRGGTRRGALWEPAQPFPLAPRAQRRQRERGGRRQTSCGRDRAVSRRVGTGEPRSPFPEGRGRCRRR